MRERHPAAARRPHREARLAAARRRRPRHGRARQADHRQSAADVSAELQARTAEQLFTVLGELKGGAMKLGQALSVFEAALPEETAAPYREALTRLQEAAPPMPRATVHRVLDEQFGRSWRDRFDSFDDVPAAAASIGQVHRAVWADGREVAVKLQYPGAGPALMADFTQLSRMARLFARLSPGLEVKPLLAELKERVLEELDYRLEADAQRAFAAAYADDRDIAVPRVVASAPKAMVTEWMDGTPLSRIIAGGTTEERDRAGTLLALLHYSAPERAGLLHADPHPGNFRMLPDGRLGVVDFGAVARLPGGYPEPLGRLTRHAVDGDGAGGARDDARRRTSSGRHRSRRPPGDGLPRPDRRAAAHADVHLLPRVDARAGRAARRPAPRRGPVGRMFNLPPSYLLIHRVTLGSIGVLCQLGATAPFRQLAENWQPGFAVAEHPIPQLDSYPCRAGPSVNGGRTNDCHERKLLDLRPGRRPGRRRRSAAGLVRRPGRGARRAAHPLDLPGLHAQPRALDRGEARPGVVVSSRARSSTTTAAAGSGDPAAAVLGAAASARRRSRRPRLGAAARAAGSAAARALQGASGSPRPARLTSACWRASSCSWRICSRASASCMVYISVLLRELV